MSLDLVIRHGTIVDGSGMGRYHADVDVPTGASWKSAGSGGFATNHRCRRADRFAPGFIDGHTHMDAQVNWDRQGTCSCWHGVTSVIMGNCGFCSGALSAGRAPVVCPLPDRGGGYPAGSHARGH